jgi:hypothetical protein
MPLFLKVDEMSDSVKSFAVNDSMPKARSRRSKKKKKRLLELGYSLLYRWALKLPQKH